MLLDAVANDCSVEVSLDAVQPKLQHEVDSVVVKISVVQKSCSAAAVASPPVESPLSSAVRRPTRVLQMAPRLPLTELSLLGSCCFAPPVAGKPETSSIFLDKKA
jgi:hypothetical protein